MAAHNNIHNISISELDHKLLYCQLKSLADSGSRNFQGPGIIEILISYFYPEIKSSRYNKALKCCIKRKFLCDGVPQEIPHLDFKIKSVKDSKIPIIINIDEEGFILDIDDKLDTLEKCLHIIPKIENYWWIDELLSVVTKSRNIPNVSISSMYVEKIDNNIKYPQGMTYVVVKPRISFKISGHPSKEVMVKELENILETAFLQWKISKEFRSNLNNEDVECVDGVCYADN
jgi:hypothetical protein